MSDRTYQLGYVDMRNGMIVAEMVISPAEDATIHIPKLDTSPLEELMGAVYLRSYTRPGAPPVGLDFKWIASKLDPNPFSDDQTMAIDITFNRQFALMETITPRLVVHAGSFVSGGYVGSPPLASLSALT